MDQLILRDLNGDASGNRIGRKAWLSPIRNGLTGEYVLTRNNTSSKVNPASAFAPQLTINGAPDYGVSIFAGAGLSQDNWYDTGLRDSQELTLAVAFKAPIGSSVLFGNFNGGNAPLNTSLLFLGGSVAGLASSTGESVQTDPVAVDASADWTIAMMRTTGTDDFTVKVDLFKAGARIGGNVKAAVSARRVDTTVPFAIGSARGTDGLGSYNGSARYLLAAAYSRALSDDEALVMAQGWSLFARACGVAI